MIVPPDYIPLGSVVSLKGNPKKMMVIARGLILDEDDVRTYYDYGFCLYPEGMVGDAVIYSNHDQIQTIHFNGFVGEEEDDMVHRIKEAVRSMDIPRAQPSVIGTW